MSDHEKLEKCRIPVSNCPVDYLHGQTRGQTMTGFWIFAKRLGDLVTKS